ncbi:MAG: hypothetical protein QNK23_07920 [Crocinitomicaceae bacterium]|nr:hypothetical protein [Crocinitomicaceae bacterium]
MKKLLVACLAVSFLFTVDSCKKEDIADPDSPIIESGETIQLDKTSGHPGEILTVETYMSLSAQTYFGTVGSTDVELIRAGKSISFSVPDLGAGDYDLNVSIDGTDYSFTLEILAPISVANPDQYILDYISQLDLIIDANNIFVDSLLADGVLDPSTTSSDAAVWDNIQQQADAQLAAMTPQEKQKLANILEANIEWINAFSNVSSNSYLDLKSMECDNIHQAAVDARANGHLFKGLGLIVQYKWCQASEYINAKTDNTLSKLATLYEATENQFAQFTFINLLGRRIKAFTDNLFQTGTDEFVAEEIQAEGEKAALTWSNGEVKNIFTTIKFRSLNPSDVTQTGILGDFASTFNDFISAYDDYIQHVSQALIWRPEFISQTKVVDFDRFLSVANINNSEVILLNTQIVDDNWQVAIATDNTVEDQDFSYDLVYDDGHVNISQTFNATVTIGGLAIGDFHEGGIIIYLDGTGEHGIVCALTDAGSAEWGCEGTEIGVNGTAMGLGSSNTSSIAAGCATPNIAAKLCLDYTSGGFGDWYLPSLGEIMGGSSLNANFVAAGGSGLVPFDDYWSSSENVSLGDLEARGISIDAGGGATNKSMVLQVRAVRTF